MKKALCLLVVFFLLFAMSPSVCAASNADTVLLAVNTYDENDVLDSSTQFEYDEKGLLTRSVHKSYYNGTPTDGEYYYTYTYDEAGRLLRRNIRYDEWGIDYEDIIRSYNDKGLLISDAFYGEGEVNSESKYEYDEDGRLIREYETKTSPFLGGQVENEYSYSYYNNDLGELVGVRHNETDPGAEDVDFVYNADGQLLHGYKNEKVFGYQTEFNYEYLSEPYLCIRDEYAAADYPYEGPTPSEGRFAIILDRAGQEIESFNLGTPEVAKMIYDEAGHLISVEGIENVYYTKCEFIYD